MNIPEIHNRLVKSKDKVYDNLILVETTGEKYTASNGAEIVEGDIKVKIDGDTILLNDEGELCAGTIVGEGSGIRLTEHDGVTNIASQINGRDVNAAYQITNGSTIKEGLKINGGPLADKFLEIFPNGFVPVGTTIENLISKLIYAVKFPTISQSPSFSAAIDAPTITFSPSTTPLEVGTEVTWTITGFTLYKYTTSTQLNDLGETVEVLVINDNTSVVIAPKDIVQKVDVTITANDTSGRNAYSTNKGNVSNSVTYSTATDDGDNNSPYFNPSVAKDGYTEVEVNGTTKEKSLIADWINQNGKLTGKFTIGNDSTTYKVKATNYSGKITADKQDETIDTIKAKSNDNDLSDDVFAVKYVPGSTAEELKTLRPSNYAEKTVKGKYFMYIGALGTYAVAGDVLESTEVTKANIKELTEIDYTTNLGTRNFASKKFGIIAIPQTKGIKRVYGNDSLTNAVVDFTKYTTSVSGFGAGTISLTYDVWYYPNAADAAYELKNMTLSTTPKS